MTSIFIRWILAYTNILQKVGLFLVFSEYPRSHAYLYSKPCIHALVDCLEHSVVALAARDELELGGDERVQANVDRVQASFF